MELSGTIEENLAQAVQSAKRLRGHPVYTDTLKFWSELLQFARRVKDQRPEAERSAIETRIAELEWALSER